MSYRRVIVRRKSDRLQSCSVTGEAAVSVGGRGRGTILSHLVRNAEHLAGGAPVHAAGVLGAPPGATTQRQDARGTRAPGIPVRGASRGALARGVPVRRAYYAMAAAVQEKSASAQKLSTSTCALQWRLKLHSRAAAG